jgi:hypothetical protein
MKLYRIFLVSCIFVMVTCRCIAQTRGDSLPLHDARVPDMAREDCGERTLKDTFAERFETYTPKTVVYVYDFAQDVSRRKFYKVTKVKKNGVWRLNANPVDLNTEWLKPGADVYLKVVNINRYLYDISITANPPGPPAGAGSLLVRNFLGDSIILGPYLGAFINDPAILDLIKDDPGLRELYRMVEYFLRLYYEWDEHMQKAYSPCYVFPCCDSMELASYQRRRPTYLELVNLLIQIRKQTVDLSRAFYVSKQLLATASAKLDDCNKRQNSVDSVKKLLDPPGKDSTEQKKVLNGLKSKLCSTAEISDYKATVAKYTAMVASVTSINDLLVHLPTEADLRKMDIFLENMVKSENEQLYPLEPGPNGLDLYLNIRSKDSLFSYLSKPYPDTISAHRFIPVLGRALLSFSLGPFTGFPKYLENATYAWQRLPDNTNTVRDTGNYILVQSAFTHPVLGFAAMGNLEWKVSSGSFGLGFSGGAGLTIESNPRLTGLAGGSLFLGNWRQAVLTLGVAATSINRLTNNLQTVADKQVAYVTQQPITYYKELRIGAFVSLTFTPFHLPKHFANGK